MTSSGKPRKTRVCLDTNVWISAAIRGGKPAEIIKMAEKEEIMIFTSPPIVHEIRRVLHYPKIEKMFEGTGLTASIIMDKILSLSHVVSPGEELNVVSDESDNRILECAEAAQVDFIITGDRHLLGMKQFMGMTIVPPAIFMKE